MSRQFQILVAALQAKDRQLYVDMHISADAVIVNQCEDNNICEEQICDANVLFIHSSDRGVGKSRNTAIMNSDAEIIEFADDDMIFVRDHDKLVINEFETHPEADLIIFSLDSLNPDRPLLKILSFRRIGYRKAMRYGCARIAIRRDKLINSGVVFSELFGGGAKYGSGEDTLFLLDCIKAGLHVYESPTKVADVKQNNSTWFKGYNEKYYKDKGALFAAMFPKLCYLYAGLSSIKNQNSNIRFVKRMKLYINGIKEYKKDVYKCGS